MTGIRALRTADLPAVKAVIDSCDLFPSEILDGMTSSSLTSAVDQDFWLVNGEPAMAVVYCAPERMTAGTWNVLLIAVHAAHQRRGLGTAMMRHVEAALVARGERLLLVETSGLAEFGTTRHFYAGLGYECEATIRDFYQSGEDKVVFRKLLQAP